MFLYRITIAISQNDPTFLHSCEEDTHVQMEDNCIYSAWYMYNCIKSELFMIQLATLVTTVRMTLSDQLQSGTLCMI